MIVLRFWLKVRHNVGWEPQNWSYECLFGFLLLLFHCPRVFINLAKIRMLLPVIFNALQQPCMHGMQACMHAMHAAMLACSMLFVLDDWLWLWKIFEIILTPSPPWGIIHDFYCTKRICQLLVILCCANPRVLQQKFGGSKTNGAW